MQKFKLSIMGMHLSELDANFMSSAPFAPIALFAYRRPDHLRRTVEALLANAEASSSALYVFSDGPKDQAADAGVSSVRDLIGRLVGFAEIHLVQRNQNFGLARNITEGVTEVLARHESLIVLEDDIVVGPHFLDYMNKALAIYKNEMKVGSISGYALPIQDRLPESYFIRGADCWGWATWSDRWSHFEPDGRRLLARLDAADLGHAFDLDGAMAYRSMLIDQIHGRNDSWAIRWHASCFLKGLLTLYPSRSLVHNIGTDGSGTHFTEVNETFGSTVSRTPIRLGGIAIEENKDARDAMCRHYRPVEPTERLPVSSVGGKMLAGRLRHIVRRILPPIVTDGLLRIVSPKTEPEIANEEPTPISAPTIRYLGLNELDRQIEKYLDFDEGYFVELGANDGLFQSNTWYYENHRSWRGLLVEPAPNLYLECRKNRSQSTHIVCAACVSLDYSDHFVKMIYSNAMSVSLGVETDLADPMAHAELGRQFLGQGETIFEYGALARPLSALLLEADAPREIDFMSLDVEGAEIEVLKGIDHTMFRFRYILVECRDIRRLETYLSPLGYRLLERFNEHDYMFGPG